MLSYWGVFLLFLVSRAVLAVPNREGSARTPNMNFTFCVFSDGGVVGACIFAVLFRIFEARITFFWGFLSSVTQNVWSL